MKQLLFKQNCMGEKMGWH